MSTEALQSLRIALVGNPNCGKTALFNLLTGARQKVANYAGVTVERKVGSATLRSGRTVSVIDLPGAYSLTPATPDEEVTREMVMGLRAGEAPPDALVAVVDATNLPMNLRLVLELRRLGRPMIVSLNMADVARARGLQIDVAKLSAELGVPVVETVAVQSRGHEALLAQLEKQAEWPTPPAVADTPTLPELQREVRRILSVAVPGAMQFKRFNHRIDAVVMHPVWGLVLLAVLLFLMFQAVFSWANVPMDAIKEGMAAAGEFLTAHLPDGPLRSLLVDGVIAGAGLVLAFLPQILILFLFILVLEDSGYLPRAAFLLDTVMGKVGLSGRAFIPLLSSFACAIPGIMATRTIANWRDRLATIMVAPLMTCSARLPVYALLIGAFVPKRSVGWFNLQGITLFVLYVAGVVSAMAVAWLLKRTWMKSSYQPLMLELPPYRVPNFRNLAIGLWERARIFLRRVGTIIFALTVVLWFLSSFPGPPDGATGPAIQYSLAGYLGRALEVIFAPIGFNWQISIALVPGLAAREVAVGALGTVYAMSAAGEVADSLAPVIAQSWSIATAYSLLAWYVFAPQCMSTLAVVRRETNSWRYPLIMAGYLFALAYIASFITYRATLWLT
ncbi:MULTISPECIES: ferrous iron transporter B [unclassified Rhizobacter]|uniref:ferrous iron transporter B n=1 Tax=unclassified Rhizobacter TaxID=2640088 RepID=UPI0006F35BCB|nr:MULTISPECIES: ferrous iron transporter B [unclassified Rhizobacter]KQU78151.1 iron transporter FeoB [Rhizobacter sp. Root29]KQW15897.1 iron transporter FeoB [Rhizobacter sp. Root1238]KRB25012.1 iron transporter FeoB [Rhizobacter sp. Root16D2]